MALAIKETHDCHASGAVCWKDCCPLSASAPADQCPKTHEVRKV